MQGVFSRIYGETVSQIPAKLSVAAGNKTEEYWGHKIMDACVTSAKARIVHSTSLLNLVESFQCNRRRYAVSSVRLRRFHANKVLLRRALSPPVRRSSPRWFNFRRTPSRLSNMSVA